MINTPIDKTIVNKLITESELKSIGLASIREIKKTCGQHRESNK